MITREDIERIKTEAFDQAISELKAELASDLTKLEKLNQISVLMEHDSSDQNPSQG